METVLRTYGLTKRFKQKIAVDNVSMTINKGDIYGFIGKNGAGKTTLMRMVLSLAFPTSGSIELFGGKTISEAGNKIGSLIETPAFYRNCSAYENLKRFAILYGADQSVIPDILNLVELSDVGHKKAGNFSLGMIQRLGIAIALLNEPEFIVLDEPVNGLDPEGIITVRNLIQRLNRERGITFLISSHLLDELSRTVTKYGIIDNGRLIEETTADDIYSRCRHKLKITVNDPQKAAGILALTIPQNEIEIAENAVLLSSHLDEGAELNSLLTKNDVLVSGIESTSGGLEQYFMERIGGFNE